MHNMNRTDNNTSLTSQQRSFYNTLAQFYETIDELETSKFDMTGKPKGKEGELNNLAPRDEFEYFDAAHAGVTLGSLNDQRREGSCTDTVVVTGSIEHHCHRSVLVANSNYFKAMFTSSMKEEHEGRVEIKEVESDVVSALLDFSYTGRLHITKGNAQSLLEAAALLQFDKVLEPCYTFMERNMDSYNCLGMNNVAESIGCQHLQETSKMFSLKNFADVAKGEEVVLLEKDDLVRYLSSDNLNARREEVVFLVGMRWLKHDLGNRRQYIHEVLSTVRFRFIRPNFLLDHVDTDDLVQNSSKCESMVEEFKRYHMLHLDWHDFAPNPQYKPRRCLASEVVVIVGGGERGGKQMWKNSDRVIAYNPVTKTSVKLLSLPSRPVMPSVVALRNDIYITGGKVDDVISNEVWKFESKVNLWMKMAPMKHRRYAHGSGVLDATIYVVGSKEDEYKSAQGEGSEESSVLRTVEKYDSYINRWEDSAPLAKPVSSAAVIGYKRRLYVIGGNGSCKLIQRFTPRSNQWDIVESSMVSNRCAPAVVLGGLIYVLGGGSRRVVVYDPETEKVSRVADMKFRRGFHGGAVVEGKIYVTGGVATGDTAAHDTIECYDPKTDTWSISGKMIGPLSMHGCVSICR
ncbi:KLHL29 [Branchiostoma lanceolatum]|uniref:KLHL29 protein n=1 Tax=Branchiostoma lanceolatum TaxID=7740 RepID=A0A8K0EMC7_BRALA|nr:KLHL29 [Branchiostoma lanceolatum]